MKQNYEKIWDNRSLLKSWAKIIAIFIGYIVFDKIACLVKQKFHFELRAYHRRSIKWLYVMNKVSQKHFSVISLRYQPLKTQTVWKYIRTWAAWYTLYDRVINEWTLVIFDLCYISRKIHEKLQGDREQIEIEWKSIG